MNNYLCTVDYLLYILGLNYKESLQFYIKPEQLVYTPDGVEVVLSLSDLRYIAVQVRVDKKIRRDENINYALKKLGLTYNPIYN